jgi:hypothetical protein
MILPDLIGYDQYFFFKNNPLEKKWYFNKDMYCCDKTGDIYNHGIISYDVITLKESFPNIRFLKDGSIRLDNKDPNIDFEKYIWLFLGDPYQKYIHYLDMDIKLMNSLSEYYKFITSEIKDDNIIQKFEELFSIDDIKNYDNFQLLSTLY